MTLSWRYAVASDVGLLREGNEDSAFAGRRLLAVADGMGGHAAGEVASAAAIAALEPLDETGADDPEVALRDAMTGANRTLREMVAADHDLDGMGTTCTAVLVDHEYAWLAHVGDSRAYLFREGVLQQITRDHTFVQQLVDEGRIRPEDASTHPQRNLITRVLDGRDEMQLDFDRLDLVPGDRLLLCSDGLSAVVTDASLSEVLTTPTPDDAVRRLVDLALRGGAPDNVTCIVADLVDGDPAATAPGRAVGAADGTPRPLATTPQAPDTPAVRAAALATGDGPRDDDNPDPRVRSRALRRRRAAVAGIVVLVLFAVGGTAAYAWTQRQYYVGTADDSVAIYRGVEGTLAGVDLSHVRERVGLRVDDLPDFERKRVRDGIHATGLADAHRIVDRLRAATTPTPAPKPAPTPSKTPTKKPTPKATP
jgi:serine/threonine protein phosphatase PrpC